MHYSICIITKTIKTGLLIATVQFFIFSGCKKGTTPCASGGYSFLVTSEWSPQQEIYNVGDTIFLTSTFPKTLTDQINPSLVIEYNNSVGVQGDISMYYLDTISRQPIAARDSFQLISISGSFSERPANGQKSGVNTNYIELATHYQFKGAFICKKKGIYGFGVDNLSSNGLRGKNCTNAGFNMTVTNSDKHLYFHQYALNVNPNDAYLQQKGYDFRVQ
jgi:hypothetical protein